MKKIIALMLLAGMLLSLASLTWAAESKKVILVVSFGTSYNDTRAKTIDALEAAIQKAHPDFEVRRAFTAQIIIDKLKERDNLAIDNVKEAMDRLVADGVKEVIIQPTHVMPGYEYDDVKNEVAAYQDKFDKFALGIPLLYHPEDYDAVIDALTKHIPEMATPETAVVLMGHGSHHYANATYAALDYILHAKGYENVFVGTVEGVPTIDQVIAHLKVFGAKKVVQYPFMIVAGDHANNDMAGTEEDSWNTLLTNAGFEVENRLVGLAESADIQAIILGHLAATIKDAGL